MAAIYLDGVPQKSKSNWFTEVWLLQKFRLVWGKLSPPPAKAKLQRIIVNGLAHLGFDLGQQPRPGPDHLLAGDEGLEAADLQIGVGLPGQAQGFLQIQVGGRGFGGPAWEDRRTPQYECESEPSP